MGARAREAVARRWLVRVPPVALVGTLGLPWVHDESGRAAGYLVVVPGGMATAAAWPVLAALAVVAAAAWALAVAVSSPTGPFARFWGARRTRGAVAACGLAALVAGYVTVRLGRRADVGLVAAAVMGMAEELRGLDPLTGETVWTTSLDGIVEADVGAVLATDGTRAYVATSTSRDRDSSLAVIDADGDVVHSAQLEGCDRPCSDGVFVDAGISPSSLLPGGGVILTVDGSRQGPGALRLTDPPGTVVAVD